MSDSESENDVPIEVSIKRTDKKQKIITKPKHKVISKKDRVKLDLANNLKKKIKASLEQQYEEDKIMEELKNVKLNFEERENKVIKIEDTTVQKKKVKGMGIEVVQQVKRQIRKPDNNLKLKLNLNNGFRTGFDQIVAIQRSKR